MAEPDFLWYERPAWHASAACAGMDPDLFFFERGDASTPAKEVCFGTRTRPACPVRRKCLDYALVRREKFGLWGGLTERQRRRLLRVRAA